MSLNDLFSESPVVIGRSPSPSSTHFMPPLPMISPSLLPPFPPVLMGMWIQNFEDQLGSSINF